jgi:uncharacterized glyoxalase superfamily protein PhnB
MAMRTGVPEGFHSVTPFLTCKNCSAAIDFYKRAFGAVELERINSPDGQVMHAELRIGDSIFMLNDEFDQSECKSPQALGGTTGGLHIYVPDVDAAFERAVKAGGTVKMPIADMFWGDRYGQFVDPFGHVWSIATRKEELTSLEIEERARECFQKIKAA